MASGYIGKIQNAGSQKVQGPHVKQTNTKKGTVKTGQDLRTGKSGKK